MAVNIDQHQISINLDHFVKQYFLNPSFEYLLAVVHRLTQENPEKDLEIVATVQTPLTLEPFAAMIDTLARVSQLPPSRIIVKTRNRSLVQSSATVQVLDDPEFFSLAYKVIEEVISQEFEYETDPRLFGALFGRCSYPRLELAYYLDTLYRDRSVITFHAAADHVTDCIWGMESLFSARLEWFKSWTNACANLQPACERGAVTFPDNLRNWAPLWARYYIEIIVETDYHNSSDWTEKTWKCLASGKPFIMMSGPGSLQELQRLGFQTFHPWINECYDKEDNAWKRLDLIKQEIARLADLDRSQLADVLAAVKQIAEHNKVNARKMYV